MTTFKEILSQKGFYAALCSNCTKGGRAAAKGA